MLVGIGLPRCAGFSLQQAIAIITGQECWHSVAGDKLHVVDGSAGMVECSFAIPFLRRRFPGARFILNVRDEESWKRSVLSVWDQRESFNHPLWLQPADSILDYARDYLDTCRRHLEGTDYLLWDIERNPVWEPLAMWLDLPIPDAPFPNADKLKPKPVATVVEAIPYTSFSHFY